MGVGFVRAVDFDEVQLSNLSRQIIYNREDIGKLKIDCAKERIAKLNPELKYEYINKKIENEKDIISLIADCDFCIVMLALKLLSPTFLVAPHWILFVLDR